MKKIITSVGIVVFVVCAVGGILFFSGKIRDQQIEEANNRHSSYEETTVNETEEATVEETEAETEVEETESETTIEVVEESTEEGNEDNRVDRTDFNVDEEVELMKDLVWDILNNWENEAELLQPIPLDLIPCGKGYILQVLSWSDEHYGMILDEKMEYWGAYCEDYSLLNDVVVDYILSGNVDVQGNIDDYVDAIYAEGLEWKSQNN